MGDDVEVGKIDEGDDEGAGGVAAVVACVAEDGQLSGTERLLCAPEALAPSSSLRTRTNVPISPATSLSSPEKTISQPSNSLATHSRTTTSATDLGIGDVCFHRTAFLYACPAEREEAPRAWILK